MFLWTEREKLTYLTIDSLPLLFFCLKECSGQHPQYLVPSFYTLLPLRLQNALQRRTVRPCSLRNLNSRRMTC